MLLEIKSNIKRSILIVKILNYPNLAPGIHWKAFQIYLNTIKLFSEKEQKRVIILNPMKLEEIPLKQQLSQTKNLQLTIMKLTMILNKLKKKLMMPFNKKSINLQVFQILWNENIEIQNLVVISEKMDK